MDRGNPLPNEAKVSDVIQFIKHCGIHLFGVSCCIRRDMDRNCLITLSNDSAASSESNMCYQQHTTCLSMALPKPSTRRFANYSRKLSLVASVTTITNLEKAYNHTYPN